MKLKIRPFKKVLLYYIIIPVTAFCGYPFLLFSPANQSDTGITPCGKRRRLSATVQNGVDEALLYMDALSKKILQVLRAYSRLFWIIRCQWGRYDSAIGFVDRFHSADAQQAGGRCPRSSSIR